MSLTAGSLCTGYAGLDSAVTALLGTELTWVADNDPGASLMLAERFPDILNLGDITAVDWAAVPPVDVLAAGFPCQDISCAGIRRGLRPGTRSGIWANVAAAISVLRPSLVFLENVRGLLSASAHSNVEPCPWCLGDREAERALRALGAVLGDLASLGFDAEWDVLPAAAVGAPHRRERVFILAWPAANTGSSAEHPGPVETRGGMVASVQGNTQPGRGRDGQHADAEDAGGSGGAHAAVHPASQGS